MNGTGKRDVKNHLLFEVATEIANRGRHLLLSYKTFMTDST